MAGLSEHFRRSGYAVHRFALRAARLPECCRGNLTDCGAGVRHLDRSGNEIRLPLKQCAVCGKHYAVCGENGKNGENGENAEKYIPVDNPLRFDMTE